MPTEPAQDQAPAQRARVGEGEPWLRLAWWGMIGVYAANAAFALTIVWTHLNLLQVDAPGHIASARVFAEGYFHRFYDGFFLGYVHNLFYPPLEDALIAALGSVTGGDLVVAYKLYLSLLIPAYLGSILWCAGAFVRTRSRLIFALVMLFLVNLDKPGVNYLQGLSLFDVLVIGLSAEVLGATVLFVLLRQLMDRGRPWTIALLLALTVLSHLVIGPIAVLLVLLYALATGRRSLWGALALGLALAAFFLLPAVVYRDLLFVSKIFKPHPYFLVIFLVYAVAFLRRSRHLLPVAVAGLLLVLPEELRGILPAFFAEQILPDYHYHRLAMPALVLLAVAAGALLEPARAGRFERLLRGLTLALLLVFLLRDFSLHRYPLGTEAYHAAELGEVELALDGEAGRLLTIHDERPIDFYLDSLLVAAGHDVRSAKGLYWETSRSNVLLTSYLGTLLDTSNLVLDYWYVDSPSCTMVRCFFDHFVRDYNVGWLLVGDPVEPHYLDEDARACYRRLLERGTLRVAVERRETLTVDGRRYGLYRIRPRGGSLDNGPVEVVDPAHLEPLSRQDRWFFVPVMEGVYGACQEGRISRTVYAFEEDHRRLLAHRSELVPAGEGVEARFETVGKARYRLEIDAPGPVLFRVKLNPFPGFELTDEQGRSLPLYAGPGHLLGVGHGTLTLRHRRPLPMGVGYGISLLGLVALLAWIRASRRRA